MCLRKVGQLIDDLAQVDPKQHPMPAVGIEMRSSVRDMGR